MIKDFSYRLRNSNGLYYQIEGDTLIADNHITELEHTPDGWQEKSINWKRNWDNFGVIRGFTIPLRFVLDGAEILKYLFYENGYEADCILEIHQLNNNRDYELIFSGEIDFTTFEQADDFVTVNSIEGGFQKLIKNNENTVYEIPVTDSEHIIVKLDGIDLISNISYSVIGYTRTEGYETPAIIGLHLLPIALLNTEGVNLQLLLADTILAENVSPGYYTSSDKWLFKSIGQLDINIKGDIRFQPISEADFSLIIKLVFNDGTSTTLLTLDENYNYPQDSFGGGLDFGSTIGGIGGIWKKYIASFDVDITIPAGTKAFLQAEYSNPMGTGVHYYESRINIGFNNRKTATYIKALKPETAFKRICEKMGGAFESNLLSNSQSKVAFTSLGSIIGNPGVIKTKLSDMYKVCHSLYSATMFIDEFNRLRIEDIGLAFNNDEILDIGEVKNVQVSLLNEILFSEIEAGYETQTYEEVNGKYEFNAKQIWKSNITRINKKMNIISPYRADGYGIEINRINLTGKSTTDSKSDNDVFVLSIENSPIRGIVNDIEIEYYQLKRSDVPITGVVGNSVFNWEISPKHNLLNHSRLIKSFLWRSDNILKLQSSDKNTEISSSLFSENSDIDLTNTQGLFLPITVKFEPYVEQNIYPILKSNPRGKIRFSYMGNDYYGYINEIGIQPKTGTAQQWSLICASENDFKQLLYINSSCIKIMVEDINIESASVNEPYSLAAIVYNKENVQLIVNTKPSWMTISIEEFNTTNMRQKYLLISGTPLVTGVALLSFIITNGCNQKEYNIEIPVYNTPKPVVTIIQNTISTSGVTTTRFQQDANYEREVYLYKGYNEVYHDISVNNEIILTGLDQLTPYMLKVRRINNGQPSSWIVEFFTTKGNNVFSYKITGIGYNFSFVNSDDEVITGWVPSGQTLIVCAKENSLITGNAVALMGACQTSNTLPQPTADEYSRNLGSQIKTITYSLHNYQYPVELKAYKSTGELIQTYIVPTVTNPYLVSFNHPSGSYILKIRGFDGNGNYSNYTTVTFNF